MNMSIQDWPVTERPREKLLQHGSSALSDAELLAIFLRTGIPGKTAVDLARDLLNRFGNLRNLLHASFEDFSALNGLGVAKYAQFKALAELSERYLQADLSEKNVLTNHEATERYLITKLAHLSYEVFYGLFLDTRNQLIAIQELAKGTLDEAAVYPREVVKYALAYNAASVIFAHNHPSGLCEPSKSDIKLTQVLQQALNMINVVVHDHIIVGDNRTISLRQRGDLIN